MALHSFRICGNLNQISGHGCTDFRQSYLSISVTRSARVLAESVMNESLSTWWWNIRQSIDIASASSSIRTSSSEPFPWSSCPSRKWVGCSILRKTGLATDMTWWNAEMLTFSGPTSSKMSSSMAMMEFSALVLEFWPGWCLGMNVSEEICHIFIDLLSTSHWIA